MRLVPLLALVCGLACTPAAAQGTGSGSNSLEVTALGDSGCVSGQLPRRCDVGTAMGTPYNAGTLPRPALPTLFDQGGGMVEVAPQGVLAEPTGAVASASMNTVFVAEMGHNVIRALVLETGGASSREGRGGLAAHFS